MPLIEDPISQRVIGCAIAVHRALGPGLYESAYESCLTAEFEADGLQFRRQVPLKVSYRHLVLKQAYRMDFVVQDELLLEIKTVSQLLSLHDAQILTYLKISGIRHGLLINFNVRLLKDGIRSFLM